MGLGVILSVKISNRSHNSPVKTAIRISLAGLVRHVGRPQLQRKHDPVRELGEVVQGLHVLEALEVQGQDPRESLQPDFFLGLLFVFACVCTLFCARLTPHM